MKTLYLFPLAVWAVSAPAWAAPEHLDSLTLDDGSRLDGTVLEDTDDHVLLQDHGVQRRFSRSRVLTVRYNDPEAPAPEVAPAPAASPAAAPAPAPALQPGADPALTDYCNAVAEQYQVPVYQVVAVQQRLPMEEVPVVFHLAAAAHVAPGVVLDLRLGGRSWADVGLRLGLRNDVYFVPGGRVVLGTPYERLYLGFWSRPLKVRQGLRLADADIIDCVNLAFVSRHYHRPLVEVVRVPREERFYRHAWRPLPAPVFRAEERRERGELRRVEAHEHREAADIHREAVHERNAEAKEERWEQREERQEGRHRERGWEGKDEGRGEREHGDRD